jgi:hypothetical protein
MALHRRQPQQDRATVCTARLWLEAKAAGLSERPQRMLKLLENHGSWLEFMDRLNLKVADE